MSVRCYFEGAAGRTRLFIFGIGIIFCLGWTLIFPRLFICLFSLTYVFMVHGLYMGHLLS